jgi:hypothetical protein
MVGGLVPGCTGIAGKGQAALGSMVTTRQDGRRSNGAGNE